MKRFNHPRILLIVGIFLTCILPFSKSEASRNIGLSEKPKVSDQRLAAGWILKEGGWDWHSCMKKAGFNPGLVTDGWDAQNAQCLREIIKRMRVGKSKLDFHHLQRCIQRIDSRSKNIPASANRCAAAQGVVLKFNSLRGTSREKIRTSSLETPLHTWGLHSPKARY